MCFILLYRFTTLIVTVLGHSNYYFSLYFILNNSIGHKPILTKKCNIIFNISAWSNHTRFPFDLTFKKKKKPNHNNAVHNFIVKHENVKIIINIVDVAASIFSRFYFISHRAEATKRFFVHTSVPTESARINRRSNYSRQSIKPDCFQMNFEASARRTRRNVG